MVSGTKLRVLCWRGLMKGVEKVKKQRKAERENLGKDKD
jgi:hypothetical protein